MRTFFLSLFIVLIPLSAFSLSTPSFTGETGIWRTRSADSVGKGGFETALRFFYTKPGNFYNYYYQNYSSFDSHIISSTLSVGIGLSDWAELFFNTGALESVLKSTDGNFRSTTYRAGDFNAGLKFGFLTESVLGIGFEGFVRMLQALNSTRFEPDTLSGGGLLIFSFDFKRPYNVPLKFHINAGYMHDRSQNLITSSRGDPFYRNSGLSFHEFVLGIRRDPYVIGTFGMEFPTRYVTPFVEYYTEQVLDVDNDKDTSYGFLENPNVLGFGVKITPAGGFAIDIGAEINFFTKRIEYNGNEFWVYPPWVVGIGFSFTRIPGDTIIIPPKVPPAPPEPPRAKFGLYIVDEETGEPLRDVIVEFSGTDLTSLVTDDSGEIISYEFPVGTTVTLVLRNEKYEIKTVKVQIENEEFKKYKVKIKKRLITVTLKGKVTDVSGQPLIAIVSFDDPSLKPVATDPQTGEFSIRVKPGRYVINVRATGYIPLNKAVEVVENQDNDLGEIKLLPEIIKKKQ